MEYIDRLITNAIKETYKEFSVIVITGPRQSGKTTLIKNIFSDLNYYTLEDLDVRNLALSDPRGFLKTSDKGLILDEVQNTPNLLSYIQGIVDANPSLRFVLSGSANFTLLKNISQSLAGRAAIFELLPMSYFEIPKERDPESIDNLLFGGLFPAVINGSKSPKTTYKNYVKTYLERDVRDLLSIKDLTTFQKFMRLCACRIGSVFNASEISNELGIAINTVKAWLSVLEASYIITMLQPFHTNTTKRLTKSPKLYFIDTGLACYLLEIESVEQLKRDKMRGHLFENFIINEALKNCYNQGNDNNLYFYRDSNQVEVDLLIKKKGLYSALEIKSSSTFHSDFENGLKSFEKNFDNLVSDYSIVYTGELQNFNMRYKLLNYKNLNKILNSNL